MRDLSGFTGKTWTTIEIKVSDYNKKVLWLAIPDVTMKGEQQIALDAIKVYAKERGIKISILVITSK